MSPPIRNERDQLHNIALKKITIFKGNKASCYEYNNNPMTRMPFQLVNDINTA